MPWLLLLVTEFVIIAPEKFHPALADYAKQKRLPTELVSLEAVLKTTNGADDPERVKRHLYGCNTGSQPRALSLLEGFVLAWAAAKEPVLGDLWSKALAHYYEKEKLATIVPDDGWYPASIFFQGMKFMLFGDPTLRMAN